jgi:hypothetical protein
MRPGFLLLIGALALASWGCGPGGCGGEPEQDKTVDLTTGGKKPDASSGGGEAAVGEGKPDLEQGPGSRFDTQGDSNKALEQAGEAAGKKPELAGPQTLFDVEPAGFGRVLTAQLPALVIVTGPECADCETVLPALRTLSRENRGKVEFYRIDGTALGASGVLPAGALAPRPAFVLYEGGKVLSQRTALPFARETANANRPEEPALEYQRRLYRWFRDALTQKKLGFGKT